MLCGTAAYGIQIAVPPPIGIENRKILADNLLRLVALHALCRIVPAGDTSIWIEHEDSVVLDPLHHEPEALLAAPELLLRPLAFDCVANGPCYEVAISLALDEVVLGPHVQRLERDSLVLLAAQDHQRHPRGRRPHPAHGLQPARIRQREVEQDHVELRFAQVFERLVETLGVRNLEIGGGGSLREQYVDQPAVCRVVLNQQHPDGRSLHYARSLPSLTRGSLTIDNQNSSIACTTSTN